MAEDSGCPGGVQRRSCLCALGRAFFQTEPNLLLELRKLEEGSSKPLFHVKLASAFTTFHPKVWIIHGSTPAAIVGSGNLTGGGLVGNVECGIYTSTADDVAALQQWFEEQWKSAPPLEEAYEKYIKSYHKIQPFLKPIRAMIDDATHEQAGGEARWRRNDAPSKAKRFWTSGSRQDAERP
jgi:phosphatidylserine/phosphatidylglycerophosphate/cardiolipin synthase-like enzyme